MQQHQLFKTALDGYNKVFYQHFADITQNASEMAKLLFETMAKPLDYEQPQYTQITRLRARSQELRGLVFAESGRALISPFDRTDMCDLATAVDTVAGYINIISRRISLYQPNEITPAIKELGGLIVEATAEVQTCVHALEEIHDAKSIVDSINKIKSIERYADKVFNNAVAELLDREKDPIEMIKHTEILNALETAVDRAECVGEVVETILVKNS